MGILCAVDLSPSSTGALKWAAAFAKTLGTSMVILYTYRLIKAHNGEAVVLKNKIEQDARQKFALLERECLSGQGIQYEFRTEVGFIADRVQHMVKNRDVNFLVLDRKMHTENPESFNELVETAHVPLVVVP